MNAMKNFKKKKCHGKVLQEGELSRQCDIAQWADWVVRNAFERSPLPKAKKFSFLFLIAKRLKFWTSLERILIFS